jgi:hypothetical protein
MRDSSTTSATDIEAGINDIWMSLNEAAAVAGCIQFVTEGSPQEERITALAGAVADLLAQAKQHIERVEISLRQQPSRPALAAV